MAVILRYTRFVYQSFAKERGKYKLASLNRLSGKPLSDREIEFLRRYIEFVAESVVSDTTRVYLNAVEDRPSEIVARYNSDKDEWKRITAKQMTNHIYYDTQKLLKLFPDDMLTKVLSKKGNLDIYEAMLENAIDQKLGKSPMHQACVLKLPTNVCEERPSEDEIDRFFQLYLPYTKKIIKVVEDDIPVNVVGYMNYLLGKKTLSPEEKEIKERLKLACSGEVEVE